MAEPISEHNGQAIAVRPLTDHPGWLAKLYRPDQHPEDAHRLDLLISAPGTLPEADRAALYAGHVLARGPDPRARQPGRRLRDPDGAEQYRAELRRGEFSDRRFVEIDWLAKSDESIRRVGLPARASAGRPAACRRLDELAAILEGLGLSLGLVVLQRLLEPGPALRLPDRRRGSQPEKMPDLHQPNWADPLTPPGTDADRYTDRYRLGLLVAKCLTGRRDADAFHTVAASPGRTSPPSAEVLLDMLLAPTASAGPRPPSWTRR